MIGANTLARLTSLKSLTLNNLGIIEIGFLKNLKQIEHVEIYENRISRIESDYFSNLIKELNLGKNHIQAIPDLSHLTALQSLDLSHNEFTDISGLSGLSSLKHLNLSRAIYSKGVLNGAHVINTFPKLETLLIPGWN